MIYLTPPPLSNYKATNTKLPPIPRYIEKGYGDLRHHETTYEMANGRCRLCDLISSTVVPCYILCLTLEFPEMRRRCVLARSQN